MSFDLNTRWWKFVKTQTTAFKTQTFLLVKSEIFKKMMSLTQK
jgi:hypothetical protein